MKYLNFFLFSLLLVNSNFSQCIEIEKVLVDACSNNSPSQEGENEMVIFTVGSQGLNTSDIDVVWATTSLNFNGLIQNAQTAQTVASINATITGCGSLVEPTNGQLPAGSKVLLVTSYEFEAGAHSFANLNEDLIIIFQNSTTGNSGHFGNYSSSGTRSLTVSFSSPSGCSDVVSYDRSLLVKQDGTSGAEDGAFVEFSVNGTASYDNLGCQVPANTLGIEINSDLNSVCGGETVSLTADVQGAFQSVIWECSEGVFSSQGAVNTTLLVNNNIISPFYIYGGVASNCNDTIFDSLLISVNVPNVSISVFGDSLCSERDSILLVASGGTSYVWSTTDNNNGSVNDSLITYATGSFKVIGTSSCGIDSSVFNFYSYQNSMPISSTQNQVLCRDSMIVDLTINSCLNCTYLWTDGSTSLTTTVAPINYNGNIQVTSTNECGMGVETFNFSFQQVIADFNLLDTSGCIPFTPIIDNLSSGSIGDASYFWDFGNGTTTVSTSLENSPTNIYTEQGSYPIELITSNLNCSDTVTQIITVESCQIITEVLVPNIFSPNGDNQNDEFFINHINGKNLTGSIFNRWGRKVFELQGLDAKWDGGNNSSGTYYYVIEVEFLDDSSKEYNGHLQLVK